MSLGFPTNPQIGDQFTIGTTTYEWNGSAWLIVTSSATDISGTLTVYNVVITGTNEVFTSTPYSGSLVVYGGVWIDKSLYIGGTLYSGGAPVLTTASFSGSVQDGVDIDIVETVTTDSTILTWNNVSTLQSVTSRGGSTDQLITFSNVTESTSTNSGAIVISGGVGVGKRVTCESLKIADAVFDSTVTVINTTSSTVIDTFSTTQFRSAKYLIQIDEGIGVNADFELREILLLADNNNKVWATEYGVVTSDGDLGTFAAEITGTTVLLYFTPYDATNKTVKVLRTGMAV